MISQPIEIGFSTGATLYAVIIRRSDQAAWNPTLNAGDGDWETYDSSHWAQYAILLAELAGSGFYFVEYPDDIKDTLTSELLYVQQGIVPALTDAAVGPTGLGSSQGTNVAGIGGVPLAADNLQVAASLMQQGEAVSGVLTTNQMTTDLTASLNNLYAGRVIFFVGGALNGVPSNIQSYNGTTKMLTFTNVPQAPVAGQSFIIV
jgi:hypothetical protein